MWICFRLFLKIHFALIKFWIRKKDKGKITFFIPYLHSFNLFLNNTQPQTIIFPPYAEASPVAIDGKQHGQCSLPMKTEAPDVLCYS